jgi:hypothetical protein
MQSVYDYATRLPAVNEKVASSVSAGASHRLAYAAAQPTLAAWCLFGSLPPRRISRTSSRPFSRSIRLMTNVRGKPRVSKTELVQGHRLSAGTYQVGEAA